MNYPSFDLINLIEYFEETILESCMDKFFGLDGDVKKNVHCLS